ncbi:6-hydroxy-3-succinoylpyridine 3-monooxygenase HspA [Hydrogenovibrio crunogenus]|uniref:6-hydroxy-3-succinoylpyridine 3-monooxygenase HspA n=1 Tax=Hydrogenovibrio crunogenus TaxID=39765 RepID=A0A4V1C8X7_9GAMM|nr:NYN domain-containing protein [Hydrogenovibrio crunogenus]QBZ83444.1 6-hydroxy-3-succinoylpyridine 3-monooxygenase HspA [Hydrogenovibrio crunogenus]
MSIKILKTIVYIDGYNLYYGLLRKTEFKWLDIHSLFQVEILNPQESELIHLKYYTAPVLGRMCDDPNSVQRQRQYLQALRKRYPHQVSIIEGKMIATTPVKRRVDEPFDKVKVHHFEEKKSDVNLAVDIACDALSGQCEQIVLCTNDSDLEPALKRIKSIKPEIRIGLVSPVKSGNRRHVSKDLLELSDWHKFIKESHLTASQLPLKIPNTSITKPDVWS